MKISIGTNIIKAAIHCCAKNDMRSYLNGALFKFEQNHLFIASTNGHILSAFHVAIVDDIVPDCEIIIPTETLKIAAKTKDKQVILSNESGVYVLGNSIFTPIDGKFPNYRKVIPKEFSGEAGQYNIEYLPLAQKALSDFYAGEKTFFNLAHNGQFNAGVLHNNDPDAIVVIMPIIQKSEYKGFFALDATVEVTP